ncbi:choline transporter BetT [Pontibacillus halophilus JSM 076056 = DSM 19796]|uniref:Choline transporter BetT n=1 Tax=Pontibacillus halophilus JSM 076056 = DSM 19796 TaxID=1385510 RepID=A0A0A5GP26_9BACI|nr:BCCT family transporter [Pontibacillus halophilus]KGX93744.1 choline transporter BetT [Pontibacillus halophilus JSM 076056 = DSM 19796]
MKHSVIDWPTFLFSVFVLVTLCTTLFLHPEGSKDWLTSAHEAVIADTGIFYLWIGFASLLFLIWVCTTPYGRIHLGQQGEGPAFSFFSWISMLFCAGIGSGIIYWGTIEWAYYYMDPPFRLPIHSIEAIEWSAAYGLFHAGPTAWAMYCLPALPIAYLYHVKGTSILKLSEACRPVLGNRVDGWIGKGINILFMIGILGASGTTLGISVPMIAAFVHEVFGVPHTYILDLCILAVCTTIFSISVYAGLDKGIQRLSNWNVYLALFLLLIVLVFGPTLFILKVSTNSVGLITEHMLRLNTWIDPIGHSGFPEQWTLFYWAWWIVYAPFIGMFIAKISKGRTIKQMIMGTLCFGTLGCWLFYSILGNYALSLQLNQEMGVTSILMQQDAPAAIADIFHTLPLGKVVLVLFALLSIIFLSTTYDTSSYMLAAVTQNIVNGEPARWNRLFWAFGLSLPATGLMFIGGLTALQSVTIIVAIPSMAMMVILAWSFIKLARTHK